MLLSDRQRLVAEAGLLTLLAWMAVTIAFGKTPRASNAGQALELKPAPRIDRTKALEDRLMTEFDPRQSPAGLPPDLALLEDLIEQPEVTLPAAPPTVPSGTVVRMGEGVYTHPAPRVPGERILRGHGGAKHIGPVP